MDQREDSELAVGGERYIGSGEWRNESRGGKIASALVVSDVSETLILGVLRSGRGWDATQDTAAVRFDHERGFSNRLSRRHK